MSEKIVALYKDVSQFIIGTVVEETETHVTIKKALLAVAANNPNGGGPVPQFFPLSLVSTEPPFHAMGFLEQPQSLDFPVKFNKDNLLAYDLPLSEVMKALYLRYVESVPKTSESGPPLPEPTNPKNPEENIVSLY
jgi:hypothetical protein